MTQTTQQNDADRLWSRWQKLAEVRSELGERVTKMGAHWETTESQSFEVRERAWNEYRSLCREYDIAKARMDVAMARYIAAKYGLNESDVFNVD